MLEKSTRQNKHIAVFLWGAAICGLYLTSLYNYLLFHVIVEMFSIVVACGIFMIAWNSRRFLDNNYFPFIGIAYLFVAGIDLMHTLSYRGMEIIDDGGGNVPTQLWIAARYVQSVSLLVAPLFLGRRLKPGHVFIFYAAVVLLLFGSIFYWKTFPDSYIENSGLTPFKKISEYIISILFASSIVLLFKKRSHFEKNVLLLLVSSIVLTIGSELAFTFYIDVYDFSNMAGHFLKVFAFYLIYKAIIQTGLIKPYDLLFRNLKQSEENLREERDRVQKYLDVAGVMFLVIDRNQNVVLINKKGCEIMGYDSAEIIGKNWFDNFLPGRISSGVRDVFGKLMTGEIVPVEYFENPVLVKGGKERHLAWHNTLLKDERGNVLAVLSSGEDITERKRAEERLERTMEDLKRSNAELEQFAYIASHDLKEPLVVVDGFLKLLRRRYKDRLDTDAEGFIDSAVEGIKRMQALIGNLLEYSRAGRGSDSFGLINCSEALNNAIANLKTLIEESGTIVTSDALPEVPANPTQMTQLLQNLIGNAIKFRSKAPPVIHVSAEEREGEWVFCVKDNGIGIESRHIGRIFDIFYRLHRNGESQGTGMGLAICKKIVERHGGRIWAESEHGRGSAFYFTIPSRKRQI